MNNSDKDLQVCRYNTGDIEDVLVDVKGKNFIEYRKNWKNAEL